MLKIKRQIRNVYMGLKGVIVAKIRYKNSPYFLCSRGIGDTMIFLSKLEEYRKIYPNRQINIIIQENQAVLAESYEQYLDSIEIIDSKTMWGLYRAALWHLLPSNIKFILPQTGFQKLSLDAYSIEDLILEVLELPPHTYQYTPPTFKRLNINILDKYKLQKNKTVIIAPYAFSVPQLNMNFWNRIVALYRKYGYQVITNKNLDEEALPDTLGLSLSLDQTYLLAEYCGIFIGLRSGLCDLLAYSTCKMTVVYPKSQSINWKEKYTFSKMHFTKNIEEIQEDELEQWLVSLEEELKENIP